MRQNHLLCNLLALALAVACTAFEHGVLEENKIASLPPPIDTSTEVDFPWTLCDPDRTMASLSETRNRAGVLRSSRLVVRRTVRVTDVLDAEGTPPPSRQGIYSTVRII